MRRADLRLVDRRDAQRWRRERRAVAIVVAVVAGCFALATLRGADQARREFDARAVTRHALERALEVGNDAPEVQVALGDVTAAVRARPLDAGRRVAYAALLLGIARSLDDVEAAGEQADLATRLAPVTVPVVRSAAQVLVRGVQRGRAVVLTRSMFDYDAEAAADLLVQLEPFLTPDEIAAARPTTPDAALAWARRLQRDGRAEEGAAAVEAARRDRPDHPGLLRHRAVALARAQDWTALSALLPDDVELPAVPERPELLAYRARWRCAAGPDDGGAADAEGAAATARDPWQRLAAGDALLACGNEAAARRAWSHALHRARDRPSSLRIDLRVRLARAEERAGDPAAALRHWRAVLALAPGHAEAAGAVERLRNPR